MKKTMPKLKRQRKRKLDSTLNKSVSTYGRIPIRIISPNINWMKATEEGEKSRCSTAKGLFSDSDGSVIINSSMVPKNQEYETRPKKLKRSFPKRSTQAKKPKKLQKENVQVKNAAVSVAIAKENEPNNELSNDTEKNKCIKHSSLADSPHY
uniref:Uncharacterized protein n=1 Tax=Ciona savignyi TaxID=51511 RepID=H2ZHE3_CIOSA